MANSYDQELGLSTTNYKLYSAEQDSGVVRIAQIFADKLGESFRGPMKDLALVLQALTGFSNAGVSQSVSVLGGIQNYGAPGMLPGGGSGLIGGRDFTSLYAAQALQRDLISRFHNPVTGISSPGAFGLNQAQLGQAAGLALRSGIQYGSGPIFDTFNVDAAYRQKQMAEAAQIYQQTGNRQPFAQAEALRVGQLDVRLNQTGQTVMTKAMEDANALLSSIGKVLGSQALTDLEDTMNKVFGGDASQFGLRAARMRMLNIQAIAGNYGEGPEGARTAVAMLQSAAQTVGSGNVAADYHAAMFVERQGRAGGRASRMNAGVASGQGYSLPVATEAEVIDIRARQTGKVMRQEEEVVFAEAALQSVGGGTDAQRARLKEAYADMAAAGSDEKKVEAARSKFRSIYSEIGITPQEMGGYDRAVKNLNPEAAERFGTMGATAVQTRNQGLMRELFSSNPRFGISGFSGKEAADFGVGAVNMDPTLRGELADILNTGDPLTRKARLAEFRYRNPGVGDAMMTDVDKFWQIAESGSVTGATLEKFAGAVGPKGAYRELEGVVGEGTIRAQSQEDYHALLRAHAQKDLPTWSIMGPLVAGLTGVRDFTQEEVINTMLLNGDDSVSRLTLAADDKIVANKENLGALKHLLSPEEKKELGLDGDETSGLAALGKDGSAERIMKHLLASKRGVTIGAGTVYVASQKGMEEAKGRLTAEAVEEELRSLTDSIGIKRLSGETDEMLIHRGDEAVRKYLSDSAGSDSVVRRAIGGFDTKDDRTFKSLKRLMASSRIGQGQKKLLGETIRRQDLILAAEGTQLERQLADTTDPKEKERLAARLDTNRRQRLGLQELGNNAISAAGNSTNSSGPIYITASGPMTITGQPNTRQP